MSRTCIAIVDASRARLLVFDRNSDGVVITEELEERTDLVNPGRRVQQRRAHFDQLDTEFARDIAAAIQRTLRETGATRLIVCASPHMLGELRVTDLRSNGVVIDELRRDLSKLTPPQIREHLVEHHLLPAAPPRPGLAPQA